MDRYSIFDIIGPAMIGPSSSHTAGAAKLAYMCQKIFGRPIKKATFFLHGSFATTYKGHGTDKALIAGVCGMKPDDPRIKDAYHVADDLGLEIVFKQKDLGEVHPNTVKIVFESTEGFIQEMTGSSIGGGKAKIIAIDDIEVDIFGKYTALIIQNIDKPGFIADISRLLAMAHVNIAFMKLYREVKGENAVLVIETDESIDPSVLKIIESVDGLKSLTFIEAIK